jgi:hypothetical protein
LVDKVDPAWMVVTLSIKGDPAGLLMYPLQGNPPPPWGKGAVWL